MNEKFLVISESDFKRDLFEFFIFICRDQNFKTFNEALGFLEGIYDSWRIENGKE